MIKLGERGGRKKRVVRFEQDETRRKRERKASPGPGQGLGLGRSLQPSPAQPSQLVGVMD